MYSLILVQPSFQRSLFFFLRALGKVSHVYRQLTVLVQLLLGHQYRVSYGWRQVSLGVAVSRLEALYITSRTVASEEDKTNYSYF